MRNFAHICITCKYFLKDKQMLYKVMEMLYKVMEMLS